LNERDTERERERERERGRQKERERVRERKQEGDLREGVAVLGGVKVPVRSRIKPSSVTERFPGARNLETRQFYFQRI